MFTNVLKRELHYCSGAAKKMYEGMENLKYLLNETDEPSDKVIIAIKRCANKHNMKIVAAMFKRLNIAAENVYLEEEDLDPLLVIEQLYQEEGRVKTEEEKDRLIYDIISQDEAENEFNYILYAAHGLKNSFQTIKDDISIPQGRSDRVLQSVKTAIRNHRFLTDIMQRCRDGMNEINAEYLPRETDD